MTEGQSLKCSIASLALNSVKLHQCTGVFITSYIFLYLYLSIPPTSPPPNNNKRGEKGRQGRAGQVKTKIMLWWTSRIELCFNVRFMPHLIVHALTICVAVIVWPAYHLRHRFHDVTTATETIGYFYGILDPYDGLCDVIRVKGHDSLDIADGTIAKSMVHTCQNPALKNNKE